MNQLSSEFTIIPDVTLRWNDNPFQIDTIVISSTSIHIISVKSLEGSITFDLNNRVLIQENRGAIQQYECPITQVERHQAFLMKWLDNRNFYTIPIHYWIAFAELSTQIKINDAHEKIPNYIDYVENIPRKIQLTEMQNKIERNISPPLKMKLKSAILKEVEDFHTDILNKFNIDLNDIKHGIVCLKCLGLSVNYQYGKLLCNRCGEVSITYAINSLKDFMLIHQVTEIKNDQIMKWLKLENRHQTLRLTQKIGLKKVINSRKWRLPTKIPNTLKKLNEN